MVTIVGDGTFHNVGAIRAALITAGQLRIATEKETTMNNYTNPYTKPLTEMRTAMAKTAPSFESVWRAQLRAAAGLPDDDEPTDIAAIDARLTALADTSSAPPPNPYEAALEQMRREGR